MMVCLISCSKEREEVITDPPTIIEFYTDIDKVGSNLTIVGENFSRHIENNLIIFGGSVETNPYSWKHGSRTKKDTLDVIIPEGAKSGRIAIEVYSERVISTDILYLFKGKFTKMAPIPVERMEAVAFSINGKGYVCTGSRSAGPDPELNDLWEYDPNTDKWTQKNDFPGRARHQAYSFVIDGKAYVGGGRYTYGGFIDDFYCYNPESDTWTELAGFSETGTTKCTTFAINNKGYVVSEYGFDTVYEYNPITDEWVRKGNINVSTSRNASSFVINNTAYIVVGSDFLKYNAESDIWSREDLPLNRGYSGVGFTIGNRGYFVNGFDDKSLNYSYNQLNNSWTQEVAFPGASNGSACSFVIDDKAYIVGGEIDNYTDSNECWRFQVNLH